MKITRSRKQLTHSRGAATANTRWLGRQQNPRALTHRAEDETSSQGGNVVAGVGLFVCLFASWLDYKKTTLWVCMKLGMLGILQEQTHYMLEWIQINGYRFWFCTLWDYPSFQSITHKLPHGLFVSRWKRGAWAYLDRERSDRHLDCWGMAGGMRSIECPGIITFTSHRHPVSCQKQATRRPQGANPGGFLFISVGVNINNTFLRKKKRSTLETWQQ